MVTMVFGLSATCLERIASLTAVMRAKQNAFDRVRKQAGARLG
jgi:hypothetical protein